MLFVLFVWSLVSAIWSVYFALFVCELTKLSKLLTREQSSSEHEIFILGLFPLLLLCFIFSTSLLHSVSFILFYCPALLFIQHLNLLAEGSSVVLRAEAGVPVRPVQTGASIGTQVVFTHIHLLITVHTCEAKLAGALVVQPVHAAVAVNTGTGGAGVHEEVAASSSPALSTAAVVGVEEVLALASVQAGAGLTHWVPKAAEKRRMQGCLDELLFLMTWEVHVRGAEVRQSNATQLYCAQAPSQGPPSLRGQAT